MNVSVTIPCKNEVNYIERCVKSVFASSYPMEKIKLYVVDGCSTDGTLLLLEKLSAEYENLVVLSNPQEVTPVSLNIGLKADNAECKIILGAHAEIHPDFIQESVRVLTDRKEVGCVGGIILNQYENEVAEWIGMAMASPFGVGGVTFRTGGKDGYVDTVAFGAYRAEVFEKVGYFDEDLVRNQDDEFNFRVIKGGYKIWFTEKIVSNYFVRGSYPKLYKQYYQYGYWKVFVNVKHQTVTTLRQLVPAFFVLYLWLTAVSLIFPLTFAFNALFGIVYIAGGLYFARKKTESWRSQLQVLKTFFILHYSYGLGYLNGVKDFLILRRKPSRRNQEISR